MRIWVNCNNRMRFRFLGWEDPLEEGMGPHSSILAWGIPMDREACWVAVHGTAESDATEHTRTASLATVSQLISNCQQLD